MLASCFCFVFMIAELIGGYMSNSLAIMTDAAHLLSDLASFLISIFALVRLLIFLFSGSAGFLIYGGRTL